MGGDMVGLVAFDFVLGVIFRGVTHMTLVVEVPGVDRDNRPRHPACLGIPAYVIANLKPFNHPAESSFFPESLSSIRSHRRALRHVRFMIKTAALESPIQKAGTGKRAYRPLAPSSATNCKTGAATFAHCSGHIMARRRDATGIFLIQKRFVMARNTCARVPTFQKRTN